jgi:hypothetical protein
LLQVVGLSWKEMNTMTQNMTVERNISFTFTMDNKVPTLVWGGGGRKPRRRNGAG